MNDHWMHEHQSKNKWRNYAYDAALYFALALLLGYALYAI